MEYKLSQTQISVHLYRHGGDQNNIQVCVCVYPIMHVHGHMHVDTD